MWHMLLISFKYSYTRPCCSADTYEREADAGEGPSEEPKKRMTRMEEAAMG